VITGHPPDWKLAIRSELKSAGLGPFRLYSAKLQADNSKGIGSFILMGVGLFHCK